MKLDIKSDGITAVASLSGEIDHHNAQNIRKQLDKYIISVQPKELAMDFKNISFMDSSGIGLIIGRYKLMHECGGTLIVRNPQSYIRRVLKLSGIEKLVKITGDKQ
jgi:stage II sporulation protein AA (anti-sigma F factor antagonist)